MIKHMLIIFIKGHKALYLGEEQQGALSQAFEHFVWLIYIIHSILIEKVESFRHLL